MKTKLLLLLTFTVFIFKTNAQCTDYVNIPDANFKASLLNDHTIDLNNDGEISCTEASDYTGGIYVIYKSISDLTGIDAFVNITTLSCYDNYLTSLDVSNNTALETLYCYDNNLSNLDISANTALVDLRCYDNNLESLNVSANIDLEILECNKNDIENLDVSANVFLKTLNCYYNDLTSLDVSNNIALENLRCYSNDLFSLNVSTNTNLKILDCRLNDIDSLDVSTNTALIKLDCSFNNLITLDASANTDLQDLRCYNNNLLSLDVSNNIALEALYCSGNSLSILDVSNCTNLFLLRCGSNSLTSLDVSTNTALQDLRCSSNDLTSLDVSTNTALLDLQCYSNDLISLDVSANINLRDLDCRYNKLRSLNVANGNNSNMGNSDFSRNTDLACIQVDDVTYANNNWSYKKDATASYSDSCSSNTIRWLGTTDNNWYTASNWSGGVLPTTSDAVEIGVGLNNYPVVSNQVTVSSITLANGATLKATATVNATVSYQKTLTDTWHLIAIPFASETYSNLITNNSFATGTGSNIGIGTYDNSSNSWNYKNATTTGIIDAGYGFSVKLASAGDITLTGTINATDVSTPITTGTASNFNLIGNPFTSYINSDTFFTGTNIAILRQQTMWIWNGSAYETITNANPTEIAPVQGFFVEALSSGNITFDSANQRNENEDYSKQQGYAHIELKVNNTSTKVYFIENTTTDFDNGYDGSLFGGVTHDFAVYTKLVNNGSDEKLAIQALPTSNITNSVIPVGLIANAGIELTFSCNTIDLEEGVKVYLKDIVNNTFVDITTAAYKVTLNEEAKGAGRFYIHTSAKSLGVDNDVLQNVTIFKSSKNQITIKGLQSDATVTMYSLLGKEVVRKNLTSTGITTFNIPTIAKGVYVVKLASEKGVITQKIILD